MGYQVAIYGESCQSYLQEIIGLKRKIVKKTKMNVQRQVGTVVQLIEKAVLAFMYSILDLIGM